MITKSILITGNHHTPAIELIHQLKKDSQIHWQVNYISDVFKSETHLVNTIIPKLKVNFFPLTSGKHNRRYLPETILGIPKTIRALALAYNLVSQINPDIVVSFGGYISVPVMAAARLHHIPTITHEQTLTNSLSTKINSLFANKIALSFNDDHQINELPQPKIVITGNLLRQEIFMNKTSNFTKLKKDLSFYPLLYITAGAQGSSVINQTVLQIIPQLTKQFTVLHHTGKLDYEKIATQTTGLDHYYPVHYVGLDDIGWVFHQAHLIISRAGANTCQEIVALQKKSILIPLPFSQQDEQLKNAQWVKKSLPHQTQILPQAELTPKTLLDTIQKMSFSPNHISEIKPQINYCLRNLIHEMV